jgi:hypothetical protein
MWKTIAAFAERRSPNKMFERCVLNRVDLDAPTAIVTDKDGKERRVDFGWHQRTPHLLECIEHGESFRIECNTCEREVICLFLCVDEHKLEYEMNSTCCLKGEIHLVGLLMDIWREVRIPFELNNDKTYSTYLDNEVTLWNKDYPLLEHQKVSVGWMKFMERHNSKFTYAGNINLGKKWYVDTENECLSQDPSWREATSTSGILADGTGSGKTASMLYHILNSLTDKNGSTLIIVPLNLVSQWRNEIEKFCKDISLVVLVQAKDLKGMTRQILKSAHIVLTTFHFLRSCKPYSDMVETALETSGLGRVKTKAAFTAWERMPNNTEPIIEAIQWRRLVVDEIHNVFESQRELRQLKQLRAHFSWGMTATPDVNTEQAQNFYWMLQREKAHHPNMLMCLLKRSIHCSKTNPCRPVPDLKLVQLTAEERLHLQSQEAGLSPAEIVQLCSFVNVSDNVQSCDANVLAQEFYEERNKQVFLLKAELDEHDRSIEILEKAAADLEAKLNLLNESEGTDVRHHIQMEVAQNASEQHMRDLARFRESRLVTFSKLQRSEKAIEFVQERLNLLKERDQLCSICMVEHCSSILPCGHFFCSSCIRRHLKTHHTCPECRVVVSDNDVRGVTIGGMGSKLMQIATLVKNIVDPIILFVQWKSMMRGMKSFLKGMHVDVLYLEGTISQRSNILDRFKTGGVLLLCLEDSFAGLHLPHAKVVIFSHAIVGDAQSVARLEDQAIARCVRHGQTEDVKIYSFVVSECCEEEIWKKTHSDY